MADDPIERVRLDWQGRLSWLDAPGADARLRRAMRRPVRLHSLKAGAPEPEFVDGARVLAKAARRTAIWLKVPSAIFEAATGLALAAEDVPSQGSVTWSRCLLFVEVGGRLERRLGRRGVVHGWLCSRSADLEPTPMAVLGAPGGLQSLVDYLTAFDR